MSKIMTPGERNQKIGRAWQVVIALTTSGREGHYENILDMAFELVRLTQQRQTQSCQQ
jgi:hypothetical protein